MSSRDILSQEEVDALLKYSEDDDNDKQALAGLNDQDIDVIGEVGNISMGTAATALFTILNHKVEITTPTVDVTTFGDLVGDFVRPCVLVDVEYIDGVEGRNVLIVKKRDAAIIADLMMGGDGLNPPEELNELHMSAVGEAMNQMMGSASTSLSNIINRSVNISPPNTELLQLNSEVIVEKEFNPEDPVVKISFQMKIGDLVDSNIMQLAPIPFVKDLVNTLMNGGSDEEVAQETAAVKEEELEQAPAQQQQAQPQVQQQPQPQQQQQQQQQPVQQPQQQQQYQQHPQQQYQQQPQQQMPNQQQYNGTSGNVQNSQNMQNVNVEKAQFTSFDAGALGNEAPGNISIIQDVPLEVTVRLGKTKMAIKDILELGNGSIIELDKLAGEPVDLLVNGKLIAKGEVVVIDENFGFRVKDIVSPMERLKQV